MICEYCDEPIVQHYGSGRFCDKVCARGFSTRAKRSEINAKVSEKQKTSRNADRMLTPAARAKRQATMLERYGSTFYHEKDDTFYPERSRKLREKFDATAFEDLTRYQKFARLRKRNKTCAICKLSEWMGKQIPLEIDHISGDRTDESEANLRVICCNCHAQTPTYKSLNRGKSKTAE
jgi:hypothetical protein